MNRSAPFVSHPRWRRSLTTPKLNHLLILVALASLAGAADARAQQGPASGEPGIWIASADGELREVQPVTRSFLRDQDDDAGPVQVVLSIETFATSATGALSAARLAVTRVRSALSASGIASSGVTSELAYLEPRLKHRILAGSWESPQRLGFDAGYLVTVRGATPRLLGRAVDAAMGAGATQVLSLASQPAP